MVQEAGADGAGGAAGAGGTGAVLFPPRILNITTPHVGHLPLIAFRPFFISSSTASAISFFALHLTQYPSGINHPADALHAPGVFCIPKLRGRWEDRQLVKPPGSGHGIARHPDGRIFRKSACAANIQCEGLAYSSSPKTSLGESHPAPSTTNGGVLSRFPYRSYQPREPQHRRNGKIRAREVRVIDENKQQLGVMALGEALRLAQSKGLELIEIAATATPPVCRIVDYGKFRYEESKKAKESQSRQPGNKMKELQLSAVIDPHDFGVKLAHAIGFLCDDMKVRVKLRFKGRQKAHKEFGYAIVNRFVREAAAYGHADSPPKMLGDRDLNVLITPLPRSQRPKKPATIPPIEPPPPVPAPPIDSPQSGLSG
jgi:translation initiation factor IF-3